MNAAKSDSLISPLEGKKELILKHKHCLLRSECESITARLPNVFFHYQHHYFHLRNIVIAPEGGAEK